MILSKYTYSIYFLLKEIEINECFFFHMDLIKFIVDIKLIIPSQVQGNNFEERNSN